MDLCQVAPMTCCRPTGKTFSLLGSSGSLALFAAISWFFLNDLFFVQTDTEAEWLIVDYATRAAALALVLASPELRAIASRALKRPAFRCPWVLLAIALTLGALTVHNLIPYWMGPAMGDLTLFTVPASTSPILFCLDMTLGLLLVAVSEEVIFRGAVLGWARNRGWSGPGILVASAIVFGLGHWSHGPGPVAAAFVTGILFALAVARTGWVLPTIFAHYAVNAVIFFERAPMYPGVDPVAIARGLIG